MKKDTIATAELNGGKEVKDLLSLMLVKYQNNSENDTLYFDMDDIEKILGIKKDDANFFDCAQGLGKNFGSSYIEEKNTKNHEFSTCAICSDIKYQKNDGMKIVVNHKAAPYLKDMENLQIQ